MSLLSLPSNFDPAFFAQQTQGVQQIPGLQEGGRSPFSNLLGQGIRGMNLASPFARSIRPDLTEVMVRQGPTSSGGRMAAPGTDMATGRPMNPNLFPFNPDPRFSSPVIRRPIPRPNPYAGSGGIRPQIPFPTPRPDIFPTPSPPPPPMTGGPFPPPMSQPPRPFGGNQFGGGIGGFFNQLAMMSPEQYTMGMDRFNQFNERFGPPMGGGFGMFNQLAQLTPEQYTAGMDRFNQFNERFGQMFPPRPQVPQIPPPMPPPMTGGPRPNPYGGFPISRPFGGGFGGQRFQPSFQMMPFSGGFGGQMTGGSLGPAINNMSMPVFPRPNQQPMTGNVQTQGAPMGLSSPTVEPPDLKGQAALTPAGGVF